ncbi:SGNH/GDSL hydrolase family protein [Photobacterium gaetbulicola]|nr:SGNH/GDSL hydrolase family protein [Photobacterium gaetbulicola]
MPLFKKAIIMGLLMFTGQVFATTIPATDYRFNYEGRVIKDWALGEVLLNWPGSAVAFQFSGSRLQVNMDGRGTQFDVLVNGELSHRVKTSSGMNTYDIVSFAEPDEVHIELVKRNENHDAMIRIAGFDVEGDIHGVWQQQPHILFYGDSITAGYGNESSQRECTTAEIADTTNARMSYASIASETLGASRTLVAYSGLGLLRNWNGNDPHHNLPYYMNKSGAIFTGIDEYEDRHPDLVVINLGGNDFSTPLQPHEPWPDMPAFYAAWLDGYVDFISRQRDRYGNVPVIVVAKIWYHEIISMLEARLAAQNIQGVYTHYYDAEYLGCNWHPSVKEHKIIADNLVNKIKVLSIL